MSSVKVTADSGGGTVALKAPSSTTSDADVVLTLPVDDGTASQYLQTNGSGALSWATVSTGKILQVKSTTKTDAASVSTAASFADIPGMSVTLTTPGSGTKALVRFDLQMSGTYTHYGAIRLLRDSTDIALGDSVTDHLQTTIGVSDMSLWGEHAPYKLWSANTQFLDTHGANGSTDVTYKLQWREIGTGTQSIYLNKTYASAGYYSITGQSNITAMEIAA